MYPVIVLAIENPAKLEEFQKVSDYDDYDYIVSQYRRLINERDSEYDFSTPLLADYNIMRSQVSSTERSQFKYKYVEENWKFYEKAFSEIKDDETRAAVVKLTLLTIIIRNKNLDKVRKAANLCEY